MKKKISGKKALKIDNEYIVMLKLLVITLFSLPLFNISLFATLAPDPVTIGTGATRSAAGVVHVEIAKPNGKGTSYNAYNEFDVDRGGLIFNNNSTSSDVNTQLDGYVPKNTNLDDIVGAKLIVNDVIGTKNTTINGDIEIAGRKADLIIANKNGIILNSGKLINVGQNAFIEKGLGLKDGTFDEILGVNTSPAQDPTIPDSQLINNKQDILDALEKLYTYTVGQSLGSGKTDDGYVTDASKVGSMYVGKTNIISNNKGNGINSKKEDFINVYEIDITANGHIVKK
ncbi:MAG: filamentous hemagglutinin N-terminal domain-containing protein [Fusobacteriaceae bacterium]|nr:filamentous hemagglutinin N-terminal domain-containing protein [Fusobacteriaceae bacterium]